MQSTPAIEVEALTKTCGSFTAPVVAAWDGAVVAADVPLVVVPTLGWVMTAAFLGSTYSTWGHVDHKQNHYRKR